MKEHQSTSRNKIKFVQRALVNLKRALMEHYKKCTPVQYERETTIVLLILQAIIFWIAQKHKVFDHKVNYFISKFNEIHTDSNEVYTRLRIITFSDFFLYLLKTLAKLTDDTVFYHDPVLGTIFNLKPFLLLHPTKTLRTIDDSYWFDPTIPQNFDSLKKCEKVPFFPLFNLLILCECERISLDGYFLGLVLESLQPSSHKKATGTYYTPKKIVTLMTALTIDTYILQWVKKEFHVTYKSMEELFTNANPFILQRILVLLTEITLLDPAVGTGHFLEGISDHILMLALRIKAHLHAHQYPLKLQKKLFLTEKVITIDLDKISTDHDFQFYFFHFFVLPNLYGVDQNPLAVELTKIRLRLRILKKHVHFCQQVGEFVPPVLNLIAGTALIGYTYNTLKQHFNWPAILSTVTQWLETFFGKLRFIHDAMTLKKLVLENSANISAHFNNNDLFVRLTVLNALFPFLGSTDLLKEVRQEAETIKKSLNETLNHLLSKDLEISQEHLQELQLIHWILEFPTVFFSQPYGFHIVMGNPPYVRQERLGGPIKHILRQLFPLISSGTADLSLYFIARSLELLCRGGYNAFITSNKWIRAKYGANLREILAKSYRIHYLIDFGNLTVFEGVNVHNLIYLIEKKKPAENQIVKYVSSIEKKYSHIEELKSFFALITDETLLTRVQQNFLGREWRFLAIIEQEIFEYLENHLRKFSQLPVTIYRGIVTGFNRAFLISSRIRQHLLEKDEKNADIIKPFVRGRDIDRYKLNWSDLWLIFTRRGINIDQYPTIKSYLAQWRTYLQPKRKKDELGRKPGKYQWYEIQDTIAYFEHFEAPKLIWQEISLKKPRFTYDERRFYVDATAYILTTTHPEKEVFLKYLLALLNSYPLFWIFKTFYAVLLSSDAVRFRKSEVVLLPIPRTSTEKMRILSVFSDIMLFLNQIYDDITTLGHINAKKENIRDLMMFVDKKVIDPLVYELYFHKYLKTEGITVDLFAYLTETLHSELLEWRYFSAYKNDSTEHIIPSLNIIKKIVKKLKKSKIYSQQVQQIFSTKWICHIESSRHDGHRDY